MYIPAKVDGLGLGVKARQQWNQIPYVDVHVIIDVTQPTVTNIDHHLIELSPHIKHSSLIDIHKDSQGTDLLTQRLQLMLE